MIAVELNRSVTSSALTGEVISPVFLVPEVNLASVLQGLKPPRPVSAHRRTIARWRTAHGITQEALAQAINIDPMTISRFERGITLPSLVTICELAAVFDVSMAQLLGDVPPQNSGDVQVIAALLKNFSGGEREFVIDTLKRYRTLQQREKRKASKTDD